jgi:hypothetical protein
VDARRAAALLPAIAIPDAADAIICGNMTVPPAPGNAKATVIVILFGAAVL